MIKILFSILFTVFSSSIVLAAPVESPSCKNPKDAIYELKFKEGKNYLEVTCPDGTTFSIDNLSPEQMLKLLEKNADKKEKNSEPEGLVSDQADDPQKTSQDKQSKPNREKHDDDNLKDPSADKDQINDPSYLLKTQDQAFEDWGTDQKK